MTNHHGKENSENQATPLTPDRIANEKLKIIPNYLIEIVNTLIAKNFRQDGNTTSSKVTTKEIVDEIIILLQKNKDDEMAEFGEELQKLAMTDPNSEKTISKIKDYIDNKGWLFFEPLHSSFNIKTFLSAGQPFYYVFTLKQKTE